MTSLYPISFFIFTLVNLYPHPQHFCQYCQSLFQFFISSLPVHFLTLMMFSIFFKRMLMRSFLFLKHFDNPIKNDFNCFLTQLIHKLLQLTTPSPYSLLIPNYNLSQPNDWNFRIFLTQIIQIFNKNCFDNINNRLTLLSKNRQFFFYSL